MNALEIIQQEHEDIERELIELEAICDAPNVNYSNLVHVFNKLHDVWNEHEQKEEKIFPIMKKERVIVPVKKMQFEHKDLRVHKWAMKKAIDSGSEIGMKKALQEHGKQIIEKLRKHIDEEDQILYTLALEEFNDKEIENMATAVGLK